MAIALVFSAIVLVLAAYGVGYDHGRTSEREASHAEAFERALARRRPTPRANEHAMN